MVLLVFVDLLLLIVIDMLLVLWMMLVMVLGGVFCVFIVIDFVVVEEFLWLLVIVSDILQVFDVVYVWVVVVLVVVVLLLKFYEQVVIVLLLLELVDLLNVMERNCMVFVKVVVGSVFGLWVMMLWLMVEVSLLVFFIVRVMVQVFVVLQMWVGVVLVLVCLLLNFQEYWVIGFLGLFDVDVLNVMERLVGVDVNCVVGSWFSCFVLFSWKCCSIWFEVSGCEYMVVLLIVLIQNGLFFQVVLLFICQYLVQLLVVVSVLEVI